MNDKTQNGFVNMISHEFFQQIYIIVKRELGIDDEEIILRLVSEIIKEMEAYADMSLERYASLNKSKDKERDRGDDFQIEL